VKSILDKQLRFTKWPDTRAQLLDFTLSLCNSQIQIQGVLTRPGYSEHKILIGKCLHVCLNRRPVESTKRLKAIFQQLYRDFMIPDRTIPFVFVHFEMSENMYDIKLQADMRKFFFKPELERQVYEKMRSYFLSEFNKMCPKYTKDELERGLPEYQSDQEDAVSSDSGEPRQSHMSEQIEEAKGKIKKFITKRIKFRQFPHKKKVNVYVLESTGEGSGDSTVVQDEEANEGDNYLSYSSSDDYPEGLL
jgi:hypothetical protein